MFASQNNGKGDNDPGQSGDRATTTSAGPSPASAPDLTAWGDRIKYIQQSRATPEVVQRIKATNERNQRAQKAVKSATRLERTNMINMASSAMALQSYSAASAPPPSRSVFGFGSARGAAAGAAPLPPMRPEDQSSLPPEARVRIMSEAATRHKKYSGAIKESIMSSRSAQREDIQMEDEDAATVQLDRLEAEMMSDMVMLQQSIPAASPSPMLSAAFGYGGMRREDREQAAASMTSELLSLLEQLATEPNNDVELAAKFGLFEDFLGTVVTIREETLKFWSQNMDQFTGPVLATSQREITNIDNSDAMGIVDDPRRWFVYSMTKKASENSSAISKVLTGLRSRLELLSQDLGECPYCLEQMTVDSSTVLGCCHRACTVCWNHWVAMKGARAFCPLCRHEEFLQEILG